MRTIDLTNLDPELVKVIQEDDYTLEWRQKATLRLLEQGMPQSGIIHAIRGNLKGIDLKKYCNDHMISYSHINNILK